MSEFKKGQLVAVKVYSDENWEPAIFERKEGIFCICRSLLNRDARLERPWAKAKPAEEVWPDIFIGRARKKASAIYQNTVEQSHQIEWLCEQLHAVVVHYGAKECPPEGLREECYGDCPGCWRYASLKALEEPEEEDEEEDDA